MGTSSAAPTELLILCPLFTQGSVRAFGTLATLGYEGVSPLQGSSMFSPPINYFYAVVLLKKGIVLEVEKKHLSLYVASLKFGVDYKSIS